MPTKSRSKQFFFDPVLLLCVAGLLALGLIMVCSASMVVSEHYYGSPFHFFIHHLVYMGLMLMLAALVMALPTSIWYDYSGTILITAFALLIIIFVPGISHKANGSLRWLKLGPFTIQVSEAVKLCFVIYLASFLTRHQSDFKSRLTSFLKPIGLLSIAAVLLLKQPDFGAVAVLFATALGMMFIGGSRWIYFLALAITVIMALAILIITEPYRLQRVTTFLHPWLQQFGSGYQLTQSLMAFGRGGITGQGLGNSIQKLYYLPEAHTDFIFPVLSEELGLVGATGILALFMILTWRIFNIAHQAFNMLNDFEGYIACGTGLWIGFQAVVNIGVASGALPTKGLTLPFISYGGTSLLFNGAAIAMVLRIHHQNCNQQRSRKRTQSKVAYI